MHGEAWIQARLTEGQYEVPDGHYWGGEGPAAISKFEIGPPGRGQIRIVPAVSSTAFALTSLRAWA
jgi:hypothetical protein